MLILGRFIGELDRTLQSEVDPAVASRHPKFFLYSGHDNTIGPLLQALRVSKGGDHPAMGSAVVIELWYSLFRPFLAPLFHSRYRKRKSTGDYNFQVLYWENSLRSVKMPHCNTGICDLGVWNKRMEQVVCQDYEEECL